MHIWTGPIKLFSYLILVLMAAAIVYAAYIAIRYWPAINV